MKLFKVSKDGGPDSNVTGFFLIEIKSLFSIVLLRFTNGSRDVFHSHAFNSLSWILRGRLSESRLVDIRKHPTGFAQTVFRPSIFPIWTSRTNIHKVSSVGTTYVISFRGPWEYFWQEVDFKTRIVTTLKHGRRIVTEYKLRN